MNGLFIFRILVNLLHIFYSSLHVSISGFYTDSPTSSQKMDLLVELNQSLKNKYSSGIALYYNSEKHLMNNFQKNQSNHCYLKWKSPERLLWEITMSFCCLFFREFYLWQMQWWDRLHVRWYKYWVVGGYIQTYGIRGGFKQHSLRLFELRCREW